LIQKAYDLEGPNPTATKQGYSIGAGAISAQKPHLAERFKD
jgi:hypothetical protein